MSNIEALVVSYALNKSEFESYKNLCDKQNKEIKAIMTELDIDTVDTKDYVAKLSLQKRESMDEDLLLELLHKNGYTDVIKTKEYVDMDLLENAIYNYRIDSETLNAMNDCKIVKEIQTLKVTRKDKEKK